MLRTTLGATSMVVSRISSSSLDRDQRADPGFADTLVPGSTNCTLVDQPSSLPVSFSESPPDQPCDEIIVDIKGGTLPYTLSVVAGTSGLYANVTGLKKKRVNLRNIVPAGQQFHRAFLPRSCTPVRLPDSVHLTQSSSPTRTDSRRLSTRP